MTSPSLEVALKHARAALEAAERKRVMRTVRPKRSRSCPQCKMSTASSSSCRRRGPQAEVHLWRRRWRRLRQASRCPDNSDRAVCARPSQRPKDTQGRRAVRPGLAGPRQVVAGRRRSGKNEAGPAAGPRAAEAPPCPGGCSTCGRKPTPC